MKADPSSLPALLDRLEARYGAPKPALPKKALEWILWENAAYLVPDERRRTAWLALKKSTGLSAEGILALPRESLRELAALGGMMPDGRVAKWLKIATIVQDSFDGKLEPALKLPLPKARRALKLFPGIADPGADKILLFTGTHALAAFESNGLRVLQRLGFAREAKNYSTLYREAVRQFDPHLGRGCAWLMRAHQLLRTHGQELCKNNAPACDECPLAEGCPAAS